MSSQITSNVFMIEPVCFEYNKQTAKNNAFQKEGFEIGAQEKAFIELNNFLEILKDNNVNVAVAKDTPTPKTPDSIFPNNWFSTHEGGILVLYPMFAQNRRDERKQVFLDEIKKNFNCKSIVDLTVWENKGKFLEGTGSMVLDRVNKIAYACKSPRTCEEVFNDFCSKLGFSPILFNAVDEDKKMIYHTNVLMCIGTTFAILCDDCIPDEKEKAMVIESLEKSGKRIIKISFEQLKNYAGNMLEIKNKDGKRLLVMSQRAFDSLNNEQKEYLEKECKILHPKIECIEVNGGGSARCMLAELF